MTTKQELRLWGVIVMTGAAVGAIAMSDKSVAMFGIITLFVMGVFIQSRYALRLADKFEKEKKT
mgnify:CR=1 FL=1